MNQNNHSDAVVSWSSGKDCAFALHQLRTRGDVRVVGLLSVINPENDRIPMHAVREDLLRLQAEALNLPVRVVMLPVPYDDQAFRCAMGESLDALRGQGVEKVVFGDLYLEDLRRYREEQMLGSGLAPIFPLWKRDSAQLARDMIRSGLKAIITSVDLRVMTADFTGRIFDMNFLNDLPAGVDPCGENGEFHTMVFDGPFFAKVVDIYLGELHCSDSFAYIDVCPA